MSLSLVMAFSLSFVFLNSVCTICHPQCICILQNARLISGCSIPEVKFKGRAPCTARAVLHDVKASYFTSGTPPEHARFFLRHCRTVRGIFAGLFSLSLSLYFPLFYSLSSDSFLFYLRAYKNRTFTKVPKNSEFIFAPLVNPFQQEELWWK
jgi:hypothetical protein